jgi:hypothetical protein
MYDAYYTNFKPEVAFELSEDRNVMKECVSFIYYKNEPLSVRLSYFQANISRVTSKLFCFQSELNKYSAMKLPFRFCHLKCKFSDENKQRNSQPTNGILLL